jgi:hypothetical protein
MKMIAQVSPDRFRGGDVRMRWKGVTFLMMQNYLTFWSVSDK